MKRATVFALIAELVFETVESSDCSTIDGSLIVVRCRGGKVLVMIPRGSNYRLSDADSAIVERLTADGYLAKIVHSTVAAQRLLDEHYRPMPAPAKPMTGFFAMLTEEQRSAALLYRGPENNGDMSLPKRKQVLWPLPAPAQPRRRSAFRRLFGRQAA